MSSVSFHKADKLTYLSPIGEVLFELSFCSPEQEKLGQNSHCNEGSVMCWHSLFKDGVLACGFPIAERAEGDGLEISFPLMVLFAKVSVSMDYDNGTILLGPSSLLFPSKRLHNAVQWHYVEANDNQVLVNTLNSCPERIQEGDISNLTSLKTFLGYYTHALVFLGTEELLQSNVISDSGLPKSKSRIELAREGKTASGFSMPGIINGMVEGKWSLPKGLEVSLAENREYYDRLDKAYERPVLMYDWSTKSAWLVSEVSLVLHMTLTFLKQPRIQQRRRRWEEQRSTTWPRLPYAKASQDGGDAAYSAITTHQDLYLYTKENGTDKHFWGVVDDSLKDMTSIRKAVNLRKAVAGWRMSEVRLQGWDFNELATKTDYVCQKEVPRNGKKPPWWQLSAAEDILVIFGGNFGQLIAPDLSTAEVSPGWETIPTQAELLVASMPCVEQLAKHAESNKVDNRYHLTSELVWHRPTGQSRSCNEFCNSSCIYIQEVRSVSRLSKWFGLTAPNPPGNLDRSQAVIFGDPKYYHQSLAAHSRSKISELRGCNSASGDFPKVSGAMPVAVNHLSTTLDDSRGTESERDGGINNVFTFLISSSEPAIIDEDTRDSALDELSKA